MALHRAGLAFERLSCMGQEDGYNDWNSGRGERPSLEIRTAANRDLPKLRSSCTTVVIAR